MKNTTAEIGKLKVNCMGTTDIEIKAGTMRKSEVFCVYPISKDDSAKVITIQSAKRFGYLNLSTAEGQITPSHQNGAYRHHYTFALIHGTIQKFTVSETDINRIKMQIFGTTDCEAGKIQNGVCFSDNSGAINVL